MDQLVTPIIADTTSADLLGLSLTQTKTTSVADDEFGEFMSAAGQPLLPYMPSQLLLDDMLVDLSGWPTSEYVDGEVQLQPSNQKQTASGAVGTSASGDVKTKTSILDLFGRGIKKTTVPNSKSGVAATVSGNKANWMDLFAELDPLANPDLMEKKLSGQHANNEAA